MSDPEKDEADVNKTPVPELRPKTVLDSIFRDGGPMPPAKIWLRLLAATLDIILLMAVSGFIIWKIAVPQAYPGALSELIELSQSMTSDQFVETWLLADGPPEGLSENLQQAITYAIELQLILFWIYFAVGEAFFSGSSLGKRLVRIRTVSTVTLGKPPILIGLIRGGTKTFLIFFPLGCLINLGVLFFNKRKQMGHDLLSRTAVVDEKFVNLTPNT